MVNISGHIKDSAKIKKKMFDLLKDHDRDDNFLRRFLNASNTNFLQIIKLLKKKHWLFTISQNLFHS